MTPITSFSTLTEALARMERRRRVALVCPSDDHTEYVLRRGLEERTADFLLCCVSGAKGTDVEAYARQWPGRVDVEYSPTADEAARHAVVAVGEGRADVLMKGSINTDNLLHAVLNKQWGLLRPGAVMSHITAVEAPQLDRLLLVSDVAVIPKPTLEQFQAITGYAIATARRLGTERPRVALTHCTEKISEKFPHTLSYAALRDRAADYGPCAIEGPMDVKTALDAESARVKGIKGEVAGQADILIFPNIEAGNTFYKTVSFFGHSRMAGMLVGTTTPVVLASRADSGESKYCSLALAALATD